MSEGDSGVTRREFVARGGMVAAGTALGGAALPHVHAAGSDAIGLALIGCGGRGCGAVGDAMQSSFGPVRLVAMADIYERRLASAHKVLGEQFGEQIEVPEDRRFVGFDAYRRAIDCLRPGDVAMLTGYSAWRAMQLEYAVEKGVNVFMEKSFACDPPGVRRIVRAGEMAERKNLKVACGLMARHSPNRQELIRRIREGELGQIQSVRAYRVHASGGLGRRKADVKELDWQIQHPVHFIWVSGGLWAEMNIHQVDEICWVMDQWPTSAHGVGGRVANSGDCGQNFDSISIEYTFPDGGKGYAISRWLSKCHSDFNTYIHGAKCAALFPWTLNHRDAVLIYKDQRCARDNVAWQIGKESCSHWQAEWNALLESIRKDRAHNEARRAAFTNLASIMGRAALHSGKMVTWEEAMASEFQFCAGIESMNADSPAPIHEDANGRYPVPVPGEWSEI